MFFNHKWIWQAVIRKCRSPLGVFMFCSLCGFLAVANEAPAPAKEGGGAAAAPAEKPWVNLQNQVLSLKTKRLQLLQNMSAIREEKSHHKESPSQLKAKMDELVKAYNEYREVTEEYNKLLVILKYRFPERLAKEDAREYKPIEVESLESMTEQLDIEGRLTKVYQKAQSQYGNPSERNPASAPKTEKAAPKSSTIREQNPILINQ